MLKNWILCASACSLTLLGCTSPSKDPLEKISYRNPASSNDLITGSRQILSDLENPDIFNSKTCPDYIFKVTDFLYHAPADYMVPKTSEEIDELKKTGSEILDTVFKIRLKLSEKTKEFTAQKNIDALCLSRIRNGLQYARFTEEYLMEWLYANNVYTYKEQNILAKSYPSTLTNPKYADFNIESGDVMLIRGKSYVSAMIARISDDEGNFSHLAMVGEDKNGKKYVIEALIQYGVVITPLEKWVQSPDARVALYRTGDKTLSKKAARFLYDHVAGLKKSGKTIRYDFAMNDSDYSSLFCSEVAKFAYDKASEGKFILPYYRSLMTKFKDHAYPKSMGVNQTTLFSPHDIEVDPRFDFIAEYRHRPLLRQVRMQDAVLQSVYNWMEQKGYSFHWAPQHITKSYIAKLARQFGLAKDTLPTYMPIATINTTVQFEGVAKNLENNIYRIEKDIYTNTQVLPSFQDLMRINEEFRIADCQKQEKAGLTRHAITHPASKFHWYFYSLENGCK